VALSAVPRFAPAQAYPTRPVRILLGFPPGSTSDLVARLLGQWLSERLGRSFVVENRPGASGNIATEAVVRAAPDGYTLLLIVASYTINLAPHERLNFNFIRDITPVASITRNPLVMVVNPSFPSRTLSEFIAHARANPGKVAMGSAGNGTIQHVSGELFKMMTGVQLLHVPYRGAPLALTDLLGGQVQVLFDGVSSVLEYIKTGKLRPLAVTSATRLEVLPGVSPVADSVPGYETSAWVGIGAPKGTPREIVDTLNQEINAALADPGMKTRFSEIGAGLFATSPAGFARFIADETDKWSKTVKFAGIKLDS